MLKDRYLRLYRSLEQKLLANPSPNFNPSSTTTSSSGSNTTTTEATEATPKPNPNPKSNLTDIANATAVAMDVATNIFRLEFEGLNRRRRIKAMC
jgi:hypothetical protein